MKDGLVRVKWILIIVVLLGLIFRTLNFEKSFLFNHDQDLYSWIAKDILVNHHQRLVGQITSVDGVFIGSAYYYVMALFYSLFKMNPLSAEIPLTLIGVFDILSLYWIIKRHFGVKAGLIAAFIQAVSFGIANFERWSVPTQPTLTWSIWFLGVILELHKGNLKVLPLYGFLVGFVWQLHIALLPILPLPIIAYVIGGNKIQRLWDSSQLRIALISIGILLVTLSPFVMFELKHDFSQIKSLIAATKKDIGAPTGLIKLNKVIETSGKEFQVRMLFGWETKNTGLFWIVWLLMTIWAVGQKKLSAGQTTLISLWFGLIFLAQFMSRRVVSEYYFTNLVPIYVVVTAVFLSTLNIRLIWGLMTGYLLINMFWLLNKTDDSQSYFYKMGVVRYIKQDMVKNGYPCIGVNFIADPGVGVGFRYLFWREGIELVKPGTPEIPTYNIPIPWGISAHENPTKFGRFGVLLPVYQGKPKADNCNKPEYQLEELLGYTK